MVKYDAATNTFTLETDAVREWSGEIADYGVTAYLPLYPNVSKGSANTVEFDAPCSNPSVFEATP